MNESYGLIKRPEHEVKSLEPRSKLFILNWLKSFERLRNTHLSQHLISYTANQLVP
jgi:hypothetical protein